MCSATFHSKFQADNSTSSKELFAQVTREGTRKCCRLVAVSCNNNLKTCAQGQVTLPRPEVCGDANDPARKKFPGLGNRKRFQIRPDSQAQMFQELSGTHTLLRNSTSNAKMLRICHDYRMPANLDEVFPGCSPQKPKIVSAQEGRQKREPYYAVGGNVNCSQPVWRSVGTLCNTVKTTGTKTYRISTPVHINKEYQQWNKTLAPRRSL